MNKAVSGYEKLPGGYRSVFSLSSRMHGTLWMGDDHLLHVRASEFNETVRRIFLKDIELITMTPNRERGWITSVLAVIALVVALWMGGIAYVVVNADPFWWSVTREAAAAGLFLAVLSLGLALVAWYWLQGPIGRVYIHTAVHREEVLALRRLRQAEKTLQILLPRIEAVQGGLASLLVQRAPEPERVWLPSRFEVRPADNLKPKKPFQRGWHYAFFSWVLWGETLSVVTLLVPSALIIWLSSYHLIVYVALAAVALARQHLQNSSLPIRVLTWAAIGLQFTQNSVTGLFSFFSEMYYAIEADAVEQAQQMYTASPVIQGLTVFFAAVLTIVALLGLLELRRGAQGRPFVAVVPPPKPRPTPPPLRGVDPAAVPPLPGVSETRPTETEPT